MSSESLLPTYKRSEDPINPISIHKIMEVILFHVSFIIGDVYFSIYNCNNPEVIINVTGYFALYAAIEVVWTTYIINLIVTRQNIVLSYNCDAGVFVIYHSFIIMWNILGAFLLSDLMDYPCHTGIYNYLFAKIIINYFYFVYKLFVIFHE
jgi:hypothetical protein